MFPSNKSNVLSITPDFVNYGYGKTEDDSIFKKLKSGKKSHLYLSFINSSYNSFKSSNGIQEYYIIKNCIFHNFAYFLAKRIAFVVLAIMMVLTGVSLGIIYSLQPQTYTKPSKIKDLHRKHFCA